MVFSAMAIRLSAPLAEWWLPVLGVLLTGCGGGLLALSMEEPPAPTGPAGSAVFSEVALEPIASRIAPLARAASEPWTDPGTGTLAAGRSRRPADCLGVDLATGRRAEAMHLATVPGQRPADCHDVRDALMGLASLSHRGRDIDVDAAPGVVAATILAEAYDVDLAAAALYGPPDRQPEAVLEEAAVDGGRGRARDYLEEAAFAWRRVAAP